MADVLASDELIDEPSDYGSIRPGTRLGRYELLVPIARGGMARVWAARLHGQRGFQKLVAIKTILPHLAQETEFERMFLDEARIASGVHHPNVCEIYELGEEKRTLYLVMEWVNGDSLARVLRASGKTEPVDARVVARIVADACAGLHAAHELTDEDGRSMSVVHRDLSPHNILLTADGTAKVADFGVAKALGQLHEATSAGQLKGKIAYMAPEQVTGAAVDRRSDVFSLGCVLYEATTGQRPFRGDGDHQVMHAVLKGEFPAPTSLLRSYPQELERIVLRALSPQPILRYPTAERMRFALEEFLARGQLITQSNVAQVVRSRIGEQIDRRKERIRQASSAGDGESGWSEPPGGMTPSNQARDGGHRSGVKPSGGHPGKPLYTTLQMAGGAPPPLPAGQPLSSTTIPQATPHPAHGSHPSHASHPSHPSKPSYPSFPAQTAPPPVMKPFAQTALMAGTAGDVPGAPPPPNTAQMRPFTIPPTSSMPPVPPPMPGAMPPQSMQPQPMQANAMQPNAMQPMQSLQPPMQSMQPMQPMQEPYGMQQSQPMSMPGAFPGSSPGQPPTSGAPSFDAPPPVAERPSNAPAGTGQYVMAIAIGVLLAVLIGVGGFVALKHRRGAATPVVDVGSTPGTDTTGVPNAGAAGAASAASPTPVPMEIVFRLTPPDAVVSIDGVELATDAHGVPRPAMGKSVTVVARAKGYEDATVLVDFFTTSPLDIALKPSAPAAVPPVADPAPPPASAAPTAPPVATVTPPPAVPAPPEGEAAKDPPKDPPKKRATPKNDPALPPNPF